MTYTCAHCAQTFLSIDDITKHLRFHREKGIPFKREIKNEPQSETLMEVNKLESHKMKEMGGRGPYQSCKKLIPRNGILKRHKLTHCLEKSRKHKNLQEGCSTNSKENIDTLESKCQNNNLESLGENFMTLEQLALETNYPSFEPDYNGPKRKNGKLQKFSVKLRRMCLTRNKESSTRKSRNSINSRSAKWSERNCENSKIDSESSTRRSPRNPKNLQTNVSLKCFERNCETSDANSNSLKIKSKHSEKSETLCFDQSAQSSSEQTPSQKEKFWCLKCNQNFNDPNELREHTPTCLLSCAICKTRFQEPNELRKHVKKCPWKYKCIKCNQSFSSRFNLKRHRLVHTGITKAFVCQICYTPFTTRGNLNTHMKIHTETAMFKCELCHHNFRQKSNYERHVRKGNCMDRIRRAELRRSRVEFPCIFCPKVFPTKRGFYSHRQKVHPWSIKKLPKNYLCSTCGRQFSSQPNLRRHLFFKHPRQTRKVDRQGKKPSAKNPIIE